MKPRIKHTPGARHSYTASLPTVGTYGFGATPTAARESLRSQLFNLGRCQECGRPCIGWQTQQQMCGPKYDSVCVRPGSEHLDNDWRARSVGCHWTHPKYPSAVVSSVIKRGQDGAQFSGYVAVVNFAEIGTFHTRQLAQRAVEVHLGA